MLNLQQHLEMDGEVKVVSGRSPFSFEYRRPTRLLPRNVLLDHFLRKVSRQ